MKKITIALFVVSIVCLLFSAQRYYQYNQLKDQISTLQSIHLEQLVNHTQRMREIVQKLSLTTDPVERRELNEKAIHEAAAVKYIHEAYAASAIPAGTKDLDRTQEVADQFRQIWAFISTDLEDKTPAELDQFADRLREAEDLFKK